MSGVSVQVSALTESSAGLCDRRPEVGIRLRLRLRRVEQRPALLSPLSAIISAHLCASIPNFLALEYDLDELEPPWRHDMLSPPLSSFVQDGHLELPMGPGWGVQLNEEEMAKHPYREVWYSNIGRDRIGMEL